MVKSGMGVLSGRENADVDVAVGWKLQSPVGTVMGERERASWCGVGESEIQPDAHWNQSNKIMSFYLPKFGSAGIKDR
jgi:hypothetical protein